MRSTRQQKVDAEVSTIFSFTKTLYFKNYYYVWNIHINNHICFKIASHTECFYHMRGIAVRAVVGNKSMSKCGKKRVSHMTSEWIRMIEEIPDTNFMTPIECQIDEPQPIGKVSVCASGEELYGGPFPLYLAKASQLLNSLLLNLLVLSVPCHY